MDEKPSTNARSERQPTSTEPKNPQESITGLVIFGVLVVLVFCYFWFVLILWLLFAVAVLAAIASGLAALSRESADERKGWFFGAIVAGAVAFGLWNWIGRYGIDIPELPKSATAKEITQAYRDRVAHIQLAYASEERGFFSSHIRSSGGTGSGLLIANDRTRGVILTNRHVVDPVYLRATSNVIAAKYQISLASEEEWAEARVAAIHRHLDLAILLVDKRFSTRGAVQVSSLSSIEQGDEVVALGNPLGVDFVTTEGIISKLAQDEMITSCPINPGNSGGPLILKNKGLIAGFNTWGLDTAQNFNGAVVAERVFRAYTPDEPATRRRNYSGPVGLVRLLFDVLQGSSGGKTLSVAEEEWNWYSDRETVVDLLETIPIK